MRRLLLVVLAALVVAATPASAEPGRARAHRRVTTITLTPNGHGTLIRITYAGRIPLVRVIESGDPIDALAVTDIDNDGDLDILASAHGGALVMWRNAGHGQFRLASAPDRRLLTTPGAHVGRCHHADAPIQAGDDRYDAAMPRAPAAAAADPILLQFAVHFIQVRLADRQRPSGRAPPIHA
jgi:hypothetical protein